MPRAPKYRFGMETFTSKEGVRQFAGAMRRRYGAGGTVFAVDDIAFLTALIQGHIERAQKIGVGVKRFFVDYAPDHPNDICFWIERTDGSTTDFGVPACLQNIGRVNRMALRMAIRADLDVFKAQALAACGESFVSDYSGKTFPVAEAVADHVILFENIVGQFFAKRGIDLETTMLTRSADQKSDPVWNDPALLANFLAFHRTFPLRLVQRRENLSDVKKSGMTTAETE